MEPQKDKSEKKNILVIEDDRFLMKILSIAFEKEGFAVKAVADGEEGLRMIRQMPPDLVTLDLGLRKGSCVDILASLKADKKTAGIPVVIFSDSDRADEISRVTSLGAAAVIVRHEFSIREVVRNVIDICAARTATS